MCGRIGYTVPRLEILAAYPWLTGAPAVPVRYNIAPSEQVVVVGRQAGTMRWGIEGRGSGLFNLRAETLAASDRFQALARRGRVIVPVSHFYEWEGGKHRRRPLAIARRDGRPLHLAGLAGSWQGRPAVTILTTTANATLASIHDRMPVVLDDEAAGAWVLEDLGTAQVAAMLRPCPDTTLETNPASILLNRPGSEGPELLDAGRLPDTHQLDLALP